MSNAPSEGPNPYDSPVDIRSCLTRLGGDIELFQEMVRFYFEDYPPLLEKIRSGIHQGDARAVEHAAHALKGLVSNCGAVEVAGQALAIEQVGRADDLGRASALFTDLVNGIDRVNPTLAAYRK